METEFKTELIWRKTLPTKLSNYVLANYYLLHHQDNILTDIFYINKSGKFCDARSGEIDLESNIVSWAYIPVDATLAPF